MDQFELLTEERPEGGEIQWMDPDTVDNERLRNSIPFLESFAAARTHG